MAIKINTPRYYPLSQSQHHILSSELLYPETAINNICVSYYVEGKPDRSLLARAINHVLTTSQAMSLRITIQDHRHCQYLYPYSTHEWEILDFSDAEGARRESEWQIETARTHLTFLDSPLYFLAIFLASSGKTGFLLKTHHIISDAWSHQILSMRILDNYRRLLLGEGLDELPAAPFLDSLDSERAYLASSRYIAQGGFWKDQLTPLPTALGLCPPERRLSPIATRWEHWFSPVESQDISGYCNANTISPATFFLTALAILLYRVYRKPDFLVGILTHNRPGKTEKAMVGMLVNTLPLRLRLDGNMPIPALTGSISLEMTRLLRNQRFPIRMLREFSPECADLFSVIEVMYTYENVEHDVDHALHFCGHENFPLLVRPSRRSSFDPFKLEIDYRLEAFDPAGIAALTDNYLVIIKNLLGESNKPLREVLWFSPEIRERVLDSFNATQRRHPPGKTIHGVFEDRVALAPDAMAITDDQTALSHQELNRRANQLAHRLIRSGAGRDKPVAVLLNRSVLMMVSLLAILKSGSAYLPLAPEQPSKRIGAILADSGAVCLITNNGHAAELTWPGQIIDLDKIDLTAEDDSNPGLPQEPDSLAYVIYTSGSTGKPKGVMIEHRSVLNRLHWMVRRYPLTARDIILQKTPYTFDVSVWELFGWFFAGASLHFLSPGGEKEPDTILEAIRLHRISAIHFVPSMLAVFLDYLEKGASLEKLASLAIVCCSGEALQSRHVSQFRNLVTDRFGTRLFNLYGPTEATVEVTFHDCTQDESSIIPIGGPIDNVYLRILDENRQLLPPGVAGELHLGGICLARGYLNQPELTAEKFIPDPFNPGSRLYCTGDLAAWKDDGTVRFLGRLDHQVKIRGNRVETGEIETILLNHTAVRDAAVLALPDQEGNQYLGAWFVADQVLDHQSLRHFLQEELPSYMIPAFFRQLAHFPVSASGKLDRQALPMPDEHSLTGRTYIAPRDPREEEICAIWQEVLHSEKIGIQDNFFDIGGDSLRLIQILGILRVRYELNLQDLFDCPTIETLSRKIHEKSRFSLPEPTMHPVHPVPDQLTKAWQYRQDCLRMHRDTASGQPEPIIKKVLLTGATGFLGCYLTRELLLHTAVELDVLVRGASQQQAEAKLVAKLAHYFGADALSAQRHRLKVVRGDVAQPGCGLTATDWDRLVAETDTVIHAAADVRHYGQLQEFRAINVNGTRHVAEFCLAGSPKILHHISTTSIGLALGGSAIGRAFTESDRAISLQTGNVYLQTKIEAEILLEQLMPQARIYRLGNLVFESNQGKCQSNPQDNAFMQSLHAYRRLGCMPDLGQRFLDFSFVDQTATALRHLIFSPLARPGVYHVLNPYHFSLAELAEMAGLPCIGLAEFKANLPERDTLFVHAPYLLDPSLLNVFTHNDKTDYILQKAGFSWHMLDQALLIAGLASGYDNPAGPSDPELVLTAKEA